MGQSNRPLGGLRVGLSIGNSAEDGLARGFDSDQVNRVTVRLTRSLLAQGARVVLGHDWRRDGVMHAELDMAREYATERGDACFCRPSMVARIML